MPSLFSECEIRGQKIKNRIVYPPVVCFLGNRTTDGEVCEEHLTHYGLMAAGGPGLIIVEATCVSPNGRLALFQLGAWDDKHVEGLSRIVRAIHARGAVTYIQLHHAGLRSVRIGDELPIAPSNYEKNGALAAREMRPDEIGGIKELFAAAAKRVKAAGFDGVELHGCHKYLLNQFLSPVTNHRTDGYGRDKAKLALETIKAVREAVGEDFVVGIRMPGNDPDVETCAEYAKRFAEAGADFLHVSTGFRDDRPEDLEFDEDDPNNWIAQLGYAIKARAHIPVIAVNGIKTPRQAEAAAERVDFVAVARAQLADPSWANKALRGEEIVACHGCKPCGRFKNMQDCPARAGT